MTRPAAKISIGRRTVSLGVTAQWLILIAILLVVVGLFGIAENGAWLLIWSLCAAAVFALLGATIRIPHYLVVASQIISGIVVGRMVDPQVVGQILDIWYLVALFGTLIVILSILVGLVVARIGGFDPLVGAWGFMPGLATVMIAQADEMGIDGRQVAIMQLFRLVSVVAAMMALSLLFQPGGVLPAPLDAGKPASLLWLPMILAAGFLAQRFAGFIPASATIVALVLSAWITIEAPVSITLPGPVVGAAFSVIGLQVGLRFSPSLLKNGLKTFPVILLGCLALLSISAGLSFLLMAIAQVNYITSFLALVPGSIDTISVLVVTTHSSVTLVMALQTARLIILTSIGPMLANLLGRIMSGQEA